VQHIAKPILTGAKETWLISKPKGDTSVKVLFALMLLLFAFGAVAESQDASTIAAYDPDDCFEENTEQNTISAQIIATQPTTENLGEIVEEGDVAITGPNDAEGVPVGAILRNKEAQSSSQNRLTAIIEQNTMPAQTVPTQPTLETFDEVVEEVNGVAITNDAEDVPVWAIVSNNETETLSQDKAAADATTEQNKIPAQIVATRQTIERAGEGIERVDGIAIISPKGADEVPVGAILPNNELQSPSDDRKTVEGTIEPNTILTQVVGAQPEKLDEPLAITDDCDDW